MKIYVAKIIIDSLTTICKVKLSTDFDDLKKFAEKAIDDYAVQYHGTVLEKTDKYFLMQSGTTVVTITLEEHEI